MKKLIAIGTALALSASQASADVESMRTVADIGINEGSNYYMTIVEGVNPKCQYGVIFFADKASLSVLLTAKLAGRRIKTLNYDTTTTTCKLLGFVIE